MFEQIQLSECHIEEIKRFAYQREKQLKTSYNDRNQFDTNAKKIQVITGKTGEYITWYTFQDRLSKPDIVIYDYKHKNWSADLLATTGKEIAVKSCSKQIAQKFGLSWTFQWDDINNNQTRDRKIFCENTDNIYIVLVYVDIENYSGRVILITKPEKVFQYMEDPVKKSLIGIKKCLYWDDIKQYAERGLLL